MSEPLQRIGEPLRSAKAARPQRSEARSARPRQSAYQGLGQAVPGRAEPRTISNPAPSTRLLPWQQPRPLRGRSDGGSRAASAAPKPRNKKSPRRGTNATSPRAFLVKASPRRHSTCIIPHFPGFVNPSTASPEQRALPTGRAVGGALPRSRALHLGGVAQQAADNPCAAKKCRP